MKPSNQSKAEAIPQVLHLYMEGLRSHNIERIRSTFSDEIRFVTPFKTMGKVEIIEFLSALYRGFPDWSYQNEGPIDCGKGKYAVKWRQGGTHTGPLEFRGFPAVAETGISVVIPKHFFYYQIENDRLLEIRPDPIPGGAPRGIFEQIGVALPPL